MQNFHRVEDEFAERRSHGCLPVNTRSSFCGSQGAGNGLTVWLVRHSQRKRGATDRPRLRGTAPALDPTGHVSHRPVLPLLAVGNVYASLCKKALYAPLARSEGRERYLGCNLMHRKVLASLHQHLTAKAPDTTPYERRDLSATLLGPQRSARLEVARSPRRYIARHRRHHQQQGDARNQRHRIPRGDAEKIGLNEPCSTK